MNAIVLPWPPDNLSANARPNWRDKAKSAKTYRGLAAYYGRGQDRLSRPVVRIVPLPILPRKRDIDNIVGALKSAMDGLTDGGWWEDDSDILRTEILKAPHFSGWRERGVLVCADERELRGPMDLAIDQLVESLEQGDDEWAKIKLDRILCR